jgi:hypothetical protein
MGFSGRRFRRGRVALAGMVVALATAGSAAAALQALPPGAQVNDDPAAGIDKAQSVSGQDPTNADVVGGALTAGKPAVPWAVLRQQEAGAKDQVFSRSFAGGAWTTRGSGTVGGRSSASPQFRGSLNFDQAQDGEAPAIDFAGAGRTVPWATWYENTLGAGFGANNIFASRFDNSGGPDQGKWIFAGQGRGTGGVGTVPVPSLNIHPEQSAENPSVAGGSAVDPTKPGPWVTWQETTTSPVDKINQIFVSRPIGPGAPNCDNVTPKGVADASGHIPAIGGFCFQQTGIGRVGPGSADPSLNVDPTRNGIEPDIAFTGSNDGVPWVVWYEKDNTDHAISGLTHNNEMVFAAKGVSDAAADGGFRWIAVGSQLQGTLDATGTNHFGACAASDTTEAQCSLNKNAGKDAEDPRVAAGTMNAANPTSPWVTWDEDVNGVKQVFVSRLVGTGAAAHFEVVNNGARISIGANNSIRPDITFSGHTPYVSWREDIGGGIEKAFTGHFVDAANPTFVLDNSNVPLTPHDQADVREPISSTCIATPFNQDGSACQGNAIGTPFFLYTNGTSPRGLFANAYAPDAPITGPAGPVGTSSATLTGLDNPQGAPVTASFQYGTTTAYGQSTAPQPLPPSNSLTPFSARLTGLASATTIHYRAVIGTDFGTFVGADRTLRTGSPAPPPPGSGHASVGHARASGSIAIVPVSCIGASGATCRLTLRLTVAETFKGHRLIAVTARRQARKIHKVMVVGSTRVTLVAGQTRSVRIGLNRIGRKLLAHHHPRKTKLRVTQKLASGRVVTVSTQTVVFNGAQRHHHR